MKLLQPHQELMCLYYNHECKKIIILRSVVGTCWLQ
jgi:hypothetical protein